MTREIDIRFTYREDEFVNSMRLYLAPKLRPRWTLTVALLSILLSLLLLAMGRNRTLSIAIVLFAVVPALE